MVELTDFLRNLQTQGLQSISNLGQGQTITRQSVSPQVSQSASFQSSLSIFDNILKGGQLPETFRQSTVTQNLLGLGQASIDISGALSEQVAIREQQRVQTNEALENQAIALGQVNERLSTQIQEIGNSLKNIGSGQGFDPLKFFTDNPILGGIGIGGLAVGAVVLLLVLRK